MKKILSGWCLGLLILLSSAAADKLAVAEPAARGGVKPAEIEAVWGMLESGIRSGEYTLVSRGSLKQILTECGLGSSSGLVNMSDIQKAQMGRVSGVRYILISEVARFGKGVSCTMRILDASTGEIDPARTANIRVNDFDELADRIEAVLNTLLADQKTLQRCALLAPAAPPNFPAADFTAILENSLLQQNVKLQNLRSVTKILRRNHIDDLAELEPKMYVRVGKLLEVQYLVQPAITRYEVAAIPYHVEESGASGIRRIGYFEGTVRVVSARDGASVANIPFHSRINFRDIDPAMTREWMPKDYGLYIMRTVTEKEIVPALSRIPVLKGAK